MSKRFSLDDWDMLSWLKGNWKSIKEIIKVGLPLALGWSVTHSPALTGLITLSGKFLLDIGDYYLSKQ